MSGNDVLDCAGKKVAIVWTPSGKGWTVIEGEFGRSFAQFLRGAESIDGSPVGEDFFFLSWEGELGGNCR